MTDASSPTPDAENPNLRRARLAWTGEGLAFSGKTDDSAAIVLDGDSEKGPSPMEALLLSVAACMSIDIRLILEKSRVPLEGLVVEVEGERRGEVPKRYERIRMHFRFEGPGEEDRGRIERAISLSEEKYCSVTHTLRPDLEMETGWELV